MESFLSYSSRINRLEYWIKKKKEKKRIAFCCWLLGIGLSLFFYFFLVYSFCYVNSNWKIDWVIISGVLQIRTLSPKKGHKSLLPFWRSPPAATLISCQVPSSLKLFLFFCLFVWFHVWTISEEVERINSLMVFKIPLLHDE